MSQTSPVVTQGATMDNFLDEILGTFEAAIVSDVSDALKGRPGARTFGVDDNPKGRAKAAIAAKLASVELEARIDELEQFRANTGQYEIERDYLTPSGKKNWNIDIKTRNKLKVSLDKIIVSRIAELKAQLTATKKGEV